MDPLPPEAVVTLGDALNDTDPTVKNTVLDALKKLGPAAKDAVKPIAKAAGDKTLSKKAVDILVGIGPQAVPALLVVIKDPKLDANLRLQAAAAVEKIGPESVANNKEAIENLIGIIKEEKNDKIRKFAADALAKL